ncbi:MAG: CinA family nicotinamide mononucleotide deamidase-related protein [candidate division NC10 bacterium]|nr:CinA family nicotinamide mononucleotide deamidase-related protein [candidate division NC10 bacterium]
MRIQAELVAIGSELVLGQIVDTNTSFMAKHLAEIGIEIVRTATVGDALERMEVVLREAVRRSPVVITTGGIGPTEDDLTRQAIAAVTGRPLAFQPRLLEQIRAIIARRGFKMAESNKVQAFIPEGSIAIENPKGTAPGFIVEGEGYCTITLPGVPSEMQFLLDTAVIPYLRRRFNLTREILRYKTLRACGLGESAIGQQIKDLMKDSQNPTVGTLAAVGDVRIRIAARGDSPEGAAALIAAMETEIRRRLGILIYGVDDETLQGNTAALLERSNLRLAVVETFTGGAISHRVAGTGNPVFVQGAVLPGAEAQRSFLGCSSDDFEKLLREPARLAAALAETARSRFGVDVALANCGLFRAEEGKPDHKGESHTVLARAAGPVANAQPLGGELPMVRERAAILAIDLLRKTLLGVV